MFPTAFLADNDIIAVGAMNALKNVSVKIREDVSIIGIDDMPFCEAVARKLTTIKKGLSQRDGHLLHKRMALLQKVSPLLKH